MSWFLAPTLVTLRAEINERWPNRDKTSDGSLGNASHAAGSSDHNPDWRGCVCAIDIDEDLNRPADEYPSFHAGDNVRVLREELLAKARAGKLPQLWYLISEGKIYSATYGWRERIYAGASAHDHHMHISCYHDPKYADSTKPWGIADVAISDADIEKIAKRAAQLVWDADVIPNVWGDFKENPSVRAKSALVEIGRDANAIREATTPPTS